MNDRLSINVHDFMLNRKFRIQRRSELAERLVENISASNINFLNKGGGGNATYIFLSSSSKLHKLIVPLSKDDIALRAPR